MLKKETDRIRRHKRVRKKMSGSAEKPRVSIHRSLNNIYVQVIDDVKSHTLCSFSTLDKEFAKSSGKDTKTARAQKLGAYSAEKMKKQGIKTICFDRGGYQYHGRIKAVAESLREAGIKF